MNEKTTYTGMLFRGFFPVTITMPCGEVVALNSAEDACRDMPCPCGDPNHWIIKWMPHAKEDRKVEIKLLSDPLEPPKITAIHSGSDWADASAEYVILPAGTTIEEEEAAWRRWYLDEYCVPLKQRNRVLDTTKYKTLAAFIVERGGRIPNEDELEVFQD